jgi:hypothetical protein
MFRPMLSPSGDKIIGRGNCCRLCCCLGCQYLSPLNAYMFSRWWVVFPWVVCCAVCLVLKKKSVCCYSFVSVQQSSFYGYTSMLPSRYTQAVMAGESKYTACIACVYFVTGSPIEKLLLIKILDLNNINIVC